MQTTEREIANERGVRECDLSPSELAKENDRKARLYDEAVKVARKVGGRTAALATEPVSTVIYALAAERADLARIVERGRLELAGHAMRALIGKLPYAMSTTAIDHLCSLAPVYADSTLRALSKPQAEAGPATDADRPDPETKGGPME